MYPTQVALDEKTLNKLIATYKRAYIEIVDEITTATDFGVYHRKKLLGQIENILTALGENTQEFIEKELPKYYAEGAGQAVDQLKEIDAPVRVGSGFSRIHQEAIAALVDETSKAFGESLTGVNRSANILLNTAVKEEITQRLAQGQIKGEALKAVKNSVAGAIQQQGLDALVDKGGHSWTLDRYSEMLIRTKAVEARNRGLANRMLENGYDLVQVSSHGATDVCGKWEGEILSYSGATSGYKTVAQAESDGLFHPNCKHAINAITIDLARETMAWNYKTQRYEKGIIGKNGGTPPKAPPVKKTIKMNFAGYDYPLNSYETAVAERVNLKIVPIAGRGARTKWGEYADTYKTIGYGKLTNERGKDLAEATFRHELGHMLDANTLPKKEQISTFSGGITTKRQITQYLSKQPEFLEAVRKDRYQVVINRLKRDTQSDEFRNLSDDQLITLIRGGTVPVEGSKVQVFRLSKSRVRYMGGADEMFADAYGQYRTDPKLVKEKMPSLFDYFEKLGGGK